MNAFENAIARLSAARLVIVLSVLLCAAPARAGWLSNLNPFASKKSADDETSTKGAPPGSSASLSTALGSSKYNSKIVSGASGTTSVQQLNGKPIHPANSVTPVGPKGPSLLSRIGSAPANLFSKTKSLFSKSPPAQPQTARMQPQTPRMLGKPSGGSTFTHSGSTAVRGPLTTSQFLSRPRPSY